MSRKTNKARGRARMFAQQAAKRGEEVARLKAELAALKKEKAAGWRYRGSPAYALNVQILPESIFWAWQRSANGYPHEINSHLAYIGHDVGRKVGMVLMEYFDEKMGFRPAQADPSTRTSGTSPPGSPRPA